MVVGWNLFVWMALGILSADVLYLDYIYFILSIFLCNLWKFVSMYFVWLQFGLFYDVG